MTLFSKKYRLVALDLDGTTLTNDHHLSEKTILTLRELSAQGVNVAIATGRSAPSVFGYLDILALPQKNTYVVAYNGSCGFLVEAGSSPVSLFSIGIPLSSAKIILDLASELGLVAQYYNGTTGDVQAVSKTAEHTELLARYASLVGKPQVLITSYDEAMEKSLAAKILVLTNNPDELIRICNERLPPGLFHLIRGSPMPFFVGGLAIQNETF